MLRTEGKDTLVSARQEGQEEAAGRTWLHLALTIGNGSWLSPAGAQRLVRRLSGLPGRHIAQTGTGPGDTGNSPFCL